MRGASAYRDREWCRAVPDSGFQARRARARWSPAARLRRALPRSPARDCAGETGVPRERVRRSCECLHLHGEHGRQIAHDRLPRISTVWRAVDLSARRAEINAAVVELIDGHGIAQDVHVAVLLRKAVGQRLPLAATGLAAPHLQFAVERVMLGVALDGHDVDRLRPVRMDVDDEAEISGQIAADLAPAVAGVVAAHHVPVFLHKEHTGPPRTHGDVMDTVPDLGILVWEKLRAQPLVDRFPGLAAVVGSEGSCRGNSDVDAVRIRWIEHDGMQTHAARARLPVRSGAVAA